jgi:ubiquinone biosynthesis protein UbiJ
VAATPTWLAALEALLNRGIDGSQQAAAQARRLNGTALQVDIEGLAAIRVSVAAERLALVAASTDAPANDRNDAGARSSTDTSANASIQGSPLALLQLARGESHRATTSTPARITGDAEIADAYRRLFALAKPDLEEELSRVVGDFPARRLAQLATRGVAWARQARRTAGENLAEYWQEESRDLVNRVELEEFLHGVDELREQADRVEARLANLERRLKGSA